MFVSLNYSAFCLFFLDWTSWTILFAWAINFFILHDLFELKLAIFELLQFNEPSFNSKNPVNEKVKMACCCQKGTPNIRISLPKVFNIEVLCIWILYIRDVHIIWIIILFFWQKSAAVELVYSKLLLYE